MSEQSAPKRRRSQRSPSPEYKLDDQDSYVPYVPVAQRRQAKLAKLTSWGTDKSKANARQEELDEREDEEQRTLLMEAQEVHEKKAVEELASDLELAKGVLYTEPMTTSYVISPAHRQLHCTALDPTYVPLLIVTAQDMKVPETLVKFLKSKRITTPTPIQLQGIPTAFAGRDMIGIAFTGSGKTLAFCLPLIMFALEEETKLPFVRGEGPVGIILCPSRELATQTYENVLVWTNALAHEGGGKYPQLNTLLCIGGISMSDQSHVLARAYTSSWPRRGDDVRNIMSFFKRQRQTLLFSATMPRKIQDFAQSSLVKPILVNVGRAGAANLDVLQEAKMVYLLECLQKTPPPVIIFSENKNEVDDIQEYLLLKGIEAVAIHGSKSQEERQYAIKSFKSGQKDVMVASGVASKGLDFNDIQHVIIFSMPKEIEDYVHQIGRTGRSGKTGIATTFVNMNTPEQTLLDLKYLLMEAGQKVPPFLQSIEDPRVGQGASLTGCPVCGGLGHGISNCPKLEDTQRRQMASHRISDDRGGY
ncbi:P-loop containing nucleoside triphosphate hydrolase protein [Fomitopsis serialis]|uniref:P-loop containing nucleoside triphosphate hydrolase protein n=1 Tax=Fomitopsis serialis TaxID=139415 RepID=UPI0020076D4D|nr:P-loop containing nucleoside triphosphate hydrolase protein [Neoantrodia serialis]KAH9925315.1 P-loop containing nucleoside triphosphate hydrolase protein [Neoantrodia serialis]